MGFRDLLTGKNSPSISNIKNHDPSEKFVIPLKKVEEDRIGLQKNILSLKKNLSTMVLGQPGSGKTSSITFLAKQMQAGTDEPVVIFDYKGDYGEKGIYDPNNAIILSLRNSTEYWNIFREATHKRDYRTIANALFQEEKNNNGDNSNKFFTQGAQDLFWASLQYIDNSPEFPNPTNKSIKKFIYPQSKFNGPALKRLHIKLGQSNDDDVRAAAEELSPENKRTATSMYQTLRKRVGSVFDGDFAKDGDFSIREYMENPQGQTLVLDMSGPEQDIMAPMFRIFLDWSIKLGLNDKSRYSYFILDEFDEVGELQQIQRLLSTGRAQLTEAVIGVQSRAQLESVYDKNGAQTILENCPQKILMRTDDDKEYVREQIGKEKYEIEQMGYGAQSAGLSGSRLIQLLALAKDDSQTQENERYPIEEQEIGSFDRGEGIFLTENGWIWGRFPLWKELDDGDKRYLSGDQTTQSTDKTSVHLVIGSEKFAVPFGKPIGQEIRAAYKRQGGDPQDADYVHREHIKFTKSGLTVRMHVLGKNDTELNGTLYQQGDVVKISDGSELRLSDRIEVKIEFN